MQGKRLKWLFWLLLFSLFFIYSYYSILFLHPRSTHQWAQCDRISLAYNYYSENRSFLNPAVHNVNGDGTGEGVAEMPLLQYGVAQCWKVLGFHEWMYRLLEIIILTFGLYCLFLIFYMQLENLFLSLTGMIVIFTSPVLVYYGNNFLPDVPSFSLALIGWYFFFRYKKDSQNKFIFLSMLMLTVAGLLKASSLISLIAIIGIYVLELFTRRKFGEEKKIFTSKSFPLSCFIISLLIIFLWYAFAIRYNESHNSGVFLTGTRAVWEFDAKGNQETWNNFYKQVLPELFHPYFLIVLSGLLFFNLFQRNHLSPLLYYLHGFVLLGVLSVFILFFGSFRYHDYYAITFLIGFVFVLLIFFSVLQKRFSAILNSKVFITALGAMILFNVSYAALKIRMSYFAPKEKTPAEYIVPSKQVGYWRWFHWHYANTLGLYETIQSYNRSLGIKREDRVISIPDESFNISLYLMDQKGYSLGGINERALVLIKDWIRNREVKYLFINHFDFSPDIQELNPYLKWKIGSYRTIDIYRVDKSLCD